MHSATEEKVMLKMTLTEHTETIPHKLIVGKEFQILRTEVIEYYMLTISDILETWDDFIARGAKPCWTKEGRKEMRAIFRATSAIQIQTL